jgi:hypothetical protein
MENRGIIAPGPWLWKERRRNSQNVTECLEGREEAEDERSYGGNSEDDKQDVKDDGDP